MIRTQDEIVARIEALKADKASLFNFESEVLVDALEFEKAQPYLEPGVTADQWNKKREADGYGQTLQFPLLTAEDRKIAALDYLKFAWGKALDHRGLSAGRSVDKMTSYCWLLGHDIAPIKAAGYAYYGCPKLKACAELLGDPLPTDSQLVQMMNGEPCIASCDEGCHS